MSKRIQWHVEQWETSKLKPYKNNPRVISDSGLEELKKSFDEIGYAQPININTDGTVLSGHARLKQLISEGALIVDVYVPNKKLSAKQEEAVVIRMNKNIAGKWDFEILEESFEVEDLVGWGFDQNELEYSLNDDDEKNSKGLNLSQRFGAPPFSILDARQGYWQERKKQWLSIGLKSELGREDNLLKVNKKLGKGAKYGNKEDADKFGTSIFDPVLCELSYLWYSKEGDKILDPFAGGSVRGVVASRLNRGYTGIDIRKEQVEANRSQGNICKEDNYPAWVLGDSQDIPKLIHNKFDFIFSCPPYADLEVYSDDPRDISNMAYKEFFQAYSKIIKNCFEALDDNRFACFVIGEVRGKEGNYYNFVGDTIQAFKDAGFNYYNEATLITPLGTVMLRASRMFSSGRKLCKTHQNVLVFCKGDWKKAAARLGDVFIPEISEGATDDLED